MVTPYGKYSLGSGSVLSRPDRLFADIDDPEVIEDYRTTVRRDLERAKISQSVLEDYAVLDVGTGRQAIAFQLLGAKRVQHFDLSPQNVTRLRAYIEKNSLQESLSTTHADLVKRPLPKDKFDFVYLQGIVQHFSDVSLGLANCLEAVKLGGKVWLYFYRSGTFGQFVIFLVRDLINGAKDAREYFVNATALFSETATPNYFVSNVMDDFFVPFIQLYAPASYLSFLDAHGFRVIASSKMGDSSILVDHRNLHDTVVVVGEKTTDPPQQTREHALALLRPEKSVDQLDEANYTDAEILNTIASYRTLKGALERAPKSMTMSAAFRIYWFLHNGTRDTESRHAELRRLMDAMTLLVEQEFAR